MECIRHENIRVGFKYFYIDSIIIVTTFRRVCPHYIGHIFIEQVGKGWDGTIGGKPQSAGTYVWMVSGTDYTGKNIKRRGVAILVQ